MNKFRNIIISALVLIASVVTVVPAPAAVAATAKEEVCRSIDATANCSGSTGVSLNQIIKNVINILSIIVGIAAIIMIILAGLKYTTSGGDASSVSSAKNTLIFALVGLVIAAVAQVIVRFILSEVTAP